VGCHSIMKQMLHHECYIITGLEGVRCYRQVALLWSTSAISNASHAAVELSRCAIGHYQDSALMQRSTGETEEKHEHRFIGHMKCTLTLSST
jgi:hypothetical protein